MLADCEFAGIIGLRRTWTRVDGCSARLSNVRDGAGRWFVYGWERANVDLRHPRRAGQGGRGSKRKRNRRGASKFFRLVRP